MLAIGPDNFRARHFRAVPLPALMGLLAIWYRNVYGGQTVAVLPCTILMPKNEGG